MEDIKLPKASSFKTGMVYAFTTMKCYTNVVTGVANKI